jgi:hypothetical protein
MKRFAAQKALLTCVLFLSISLFACGVNAADQIPANIGTAGDFVIHSNSGSATLTTDVEDIGGSLIAANEITEFRMIKNPSNSLPISSFQTERVDLAGDDAQSCSLSKTNNPCRTGH